MDTLIENIIGILFRYYLSRCTMIQGNLRYKIVLFWKTVLLVKHQNYVANFWKGVSAFIAKSRELVIGFNPRSLLDSWQ